MSDFLIDNRSALTNLLELTAAITGLLLLEKYKFSTAKFFIWFLVYIFICESLGIFHSISVDNGGVLSFLQETVLYENYWYYTIFWKIGAIVFIAFYYHRILEASLFKFIAKVSGLVFLIFSLIHIIFNLDDYFITFLPAISVFGAVVVFIVTVLYFIELLLSDRILSFYRSLNFYITFTIFIWWLIITPLVFYDIYMSNDDSTFTTLRIKIYLFANIFIYTMYTIALIFCVPKEHHKIKS